MSFGDSPGSQSSHGETTRIEHCLADFAEDPDRAFDELAGLVYDRFRRLTAHILNQQYPDLHGQTDDAYHNALLKLRTALKNENVTPRTKQDLYGLAARHIRFALIDLVKRFRRDDEHAGIDEANDSNQQQINVVAQTNTFDPVRLAAWTEFHEAIEKLDPDLRKLIELRLYNGVSHQEAAEILEVPLTTVQGRWRTARVKLALAGNDFLPE